MKAPRIVCICGSVRFKSDFGRAARYESEKGRIVLSVGSFIHYDDLISASADERQRRRFARKKSALDRLHMKKIEMADEILVIDRDRYIGDQTRKEILYAMKLRKKIRRMSEEEKKWWPI